MKQKSKLLFTFLLLSSLVGLAISYLLEQFQGNLLQIDFESNQKGYFELYFDDGKGMSEKKVIRVHTHTTNRIEHARFDLNSNNVINLRIDPQFNDATIRISKVFLRSGTGITKYVFDLSAVKPNQQMTYRYDSKSDSCTIHTKNPAGDPNLNFSLPKPIQGQKQGSTLVLPLAIIGSFILFSVIAVFRIPFICSAYAFLWKTKERLDSYLHKSTFPSVLLIAGIAYLFLPYYSVLRLPLESGVILFLILCSLLTWSAVTAGPILESEKKSICWNPFRSHQSTYTAALLIPFGFLLVKRLLLPIAIRGDEIYHFRTIAYYIESLSNITGGEIALLVVLSALLMHFWGKLRIGSVSLLLLLSLCIYIGIQLSEDRLLAQYLIRYPSFFKTVAGIPISAIKWIGLENQEWSYRVVPFLSYLLIVVYVFQKTEFCGTTAKVLFTLMLSTLPSMLFYSGIVYYEMPVVLLLTLVVFNIEKFDFETTTDAKKHSFWYALAIMGFIKETLLPVIPAIIATRCLFLLYRERKIKHLFTLDNAKFIFIVSFPLAFYVIARKLSGDPRGYSPFWEHLTDLKLYVFQIKTLWQQFGFLLITSTLGIIIMCLQRKWIPLISILMIGYSSIVFFFLDFASNVGYSRFNLYLLPSFIYLSYVGISALFITSKFAFSKQTGIVLLIAGLLTNKFLCPLNLDGTKKPNAFLNSQDLKEQNFPIEKGLQFLTKTNHPNGFSVVLKTYDYMWKFYLDDEVLSKNNYFFTSIKSDLDNLNTDKINQSDLLMTNIPLKVICRNYPELSQAELVESFTCAKRNSIFIYKP